MSDMETIQTLLDLLNPLHGELDKQTYDEKVSQNFDAPLDAEYSVTITVQMERDLTQAVCILESRKRAALLRDTPQAEQGDAKCTHDNLVSDVSGTHCVACGAPHSPLTVTLPNRTASPSQPAERVVNWRPIASAPPTKGSHSHRVLGVLNDGTHVFAFYTPAYLGTDEEAESLWVCEGYAWATKPTHWMPLPPAPRTEGE